MGVSRKGAPSQTDALVDSSSKLIDQTLQLVFVCSRTSPHMGEGRSGFSHHLAHSDWLKGSGGCCQKRARGATILEFLKY